MSKVTIEKIYATRQILTCLNETAEYAGPVENGTIPSFVLELVLAFGDG